MSAVGRVRGNLRLRIGDADVNLGDVSIPLMAETPVRRSSGEELVAIRLTADLEEVRGTVQEIFNQTEVSDDA